MATVHSTIDLALAPVAAFDVLVEELATALEAQGMCLEAGPEGRILEGGHPIGEVVDWRPGERIALRWRPAGWVPEEETAVELRFAPAGEGTRVTFEHSGWGERLIAGPGELAGWFASEALAPLLRAMAPAAFGDWLTDRGARRPSGAAARAVYREPVYHYPNFEVLLGELALTPEDYLLEVGCGGGAMLQLALQSGCRAAAVDHSLEMVRLAREVNHEAVAEGRLEVREARAEALPFPEGTFTCAAATGMLGFLDDAEAALSEMRRVLAPGGRLVVSGTDPELRGTPAAPEPMASRLHFYDSAALEELGQRAGFKEVHVLRRNLGSLAREAGVPEGALPLFAGHDARFLVARKS